MDLHLTQELKLKDGLVAKMFADAGGAGLGVPCHARRDHAGKQGETLSGLEWLSHGPTASKHFFPSSQGYSLA